MIAHLIGPVFFVAALVLPWLVLGSLDHKRES